MNDYRGGLRKIDEQSTGMSDNTALPLPPFEEWYAKTKAYGGTREEYDKLMILEESQRVLTELLAEMPPNKHDRRCYLVKLGTVCNCQHKSLNYLNNHIRAIIEKKRKELS
jgi:hypothetical protein